MRHLILIFALSLASHAQILGQIMQPDSPGNIAPPMNTCTPGTGTTTATCTAVLTLASGDELMVFGGTPSANSSAMTIADTAVNTYTSLGSLSGNGQLVQVWTASANATGSVTLTCTNTVTATNAAKIGCVFIDLGQTYKTQDASIKTLQTATTATAWVITSTLTASNANETIITCAEANASVTSWTMSLAGFSIPPGGSIINANASFACGFDIVSSTFSYTGSTTIFTVGTTRGYAIGMVGFHS